MADPNNITYKIGTQYDGRGAAAARKDNKKLREEMEAPIYGPAVKPRHNGREQRVRDSQAGTLQGRRRREQIRKDAEEQASIEREARQRIFKRDDTSRGRTDDVKASRNATAIERRAMLEESRAARQKRSDAEAMARRFALEPTQGPITRQQYRAQLSEKFRYEPEQGPITKDQYKAQMAERFRYQPEQGPASRPAFWDRTRQLQGRTAGEDQRRSERAASLAAFRVQQRERASIRGAEGAYGTASAATMRRLGLGGGGGSGGGGGRGAGGGGSGGRGGGALGGFLKLEDKVGLGGGNKLVGSPGLIFGAVATAGAAMKFLGDTATAYGEQLKTGATKGQALTLALADAAKQIPLIGSFISGLDSIGKELSGEGAKERWRAQMDEDQSKRDARGLVIRGRKDAIRQNNDRLNVEAGDRRVFEEGNAGPEAGRAAREARQRAKEEFDRTNVDLNRQRLSVRNHNGDAGRNAVEAIENLRAEARKKLDRAYLEADKSEAEGRTKFYEELAEDSKKRESEMASVREDALREQGKVLQAEIEKLKREGEEQISAAEQAAQKASIFGENSNEFRSARDNVEQVRAAVSQRQEVETARINRAIKDESKRLEVQGLQRRGELGDTDAAKRAVRETLSAESMERQKALLAQLNTQGTTPAQQQTIRDQLAELPALLANSIKQAEQEIVANARGKMLSDAGVINSSRTRDLRRRGEMTGDSSLTNLANQRDITQEYQQRGEELRALVNDEKASKESRDAARQELTSLPARLQQSLDDTLRSTLTGRDLAQAIYSNTQDAAGVSGSSMALRERALTMGRDPVADTAKNTQKLVELFTAWIGGQANATPLLK